MKNIFCNMISLTTLDISFETSNVQDMSYMFYNNENLGYIELSSFKTDNVKDMSYMFYGCKKLLKLELDNFITTDNLIKMDSMFSSCHNLEKIQMNNFYTNNIQDMSHSRYVSFI